VALAATMALPTAHSLEHCTTMAAALAVPVAREELVGSVSTKKRLKQLERQVQVLSRRGWLTGNEAWEARSHLARATRLYLTDVHPGGADSDTQARVDASLAATEAQLQVANMRRAQASSQPKRGKESPSALIAAEQVQARRDLHMLARVSAETDSDDDAGSVGTRVDSGLCRKALRAIDVTGSASELGEGSSWCGESDETEFSEEDMDKWVSSDSEEDPFVTESSGITLAPGGVAMDRRRGGEKRAELGSEVPRGRSRASSVDLAASEARKLLYPARPRRTSCTRLARRARRTLRRRLSDAGESVWAMTASDDEGSADGRVSVQVEPEIVTPAPWGEHDPEWPGAMSDEDDSPSRDAGALERGGLRRAQKRAAWRFGQVRGGTDGGTASFKLLDRYALVIPVRHDLRLAVAVQHGSPTKPFPHPQWSRSWFVPLPPTRLRLLRQSLSHGANKIMEEPNAGGSSVNSEALSMEILASLSRAQLLLSEMEVQYETPQCSIADFVVSIAGRRIGVSVTRAMRYHGGPSAYTMDDARVILIKKLRGMVDAGFCVSSEHSWEMAILHVFAQTDSVADTLKKVLFTEMPPELWQNTLVLCTVCTSAMSSIVFKNVKNWDEMPPEMRAKVEERWRRQLTGAFPVTPRISPALAHPVPPESLPPPPEMTLPQPAGESSARARLLRESSAYTEVSAASDTAPPAPPERVTSLGTARTAPEPVLRQSSATAALRSAIP
jgi:hypothetical protein